MISTSDFPYNCFRVEQGLKEAQNHADFFQFIQELNATHHYIVYAFLLVESCISITTP